MDLNHPVVKTQDMVLLRVSVPPSSTLGAMASRTKTYKIKERINAHH
jgi:hypothetical protein